MWAARAGPEPARKPCQAGSTNFSLTFYEFAAAGSRLGRYLRHLLGPPRGGRPPKSQQEHDMTQAIEIARKDGLSALFFVVLVVTTFLF